MPDNMQELFDMDVEAHRYFLSLPLFLQDQLTKESAAIHSREDLGACANNIMRKGLSLEQYAPIFEDDSGNKIDYQ